MGTKPETAPARMVGIGDYSPRDRVAREAAWFLDVLAFRPDIEIVEPVLPAAGRRSQQEAAGKEMDAYRALHGKPGDEDYADVTALTMPSTQLVAAQRGCGVKQE